MHDMSLLSLFVCLCFGMMLGRWWVMSARARHWVGSVIHGVFFLLLLTMGYAVRRRVDTWYELMPIALLALAFACATGFASALLLSIASRISSSYEK